MKQTPNINIQITNILTVYNESTETEKQSGLTWYNRANDIVNFLSETYHRPDFQIAGCIAALSPGCDWHQNLIDTVYMLKLNDKAKVTTYGSNKLKALKILECTNHNEVLNLLLHKSKINKTASFYLNILNPSLSGHVTIDRHAIRINYDEILNDTSRPTEKRYITAQNAYIQAANQLGLNANQLQAICWITFRRIFNIPDKNKAIRLDKYIQDKLDNVKNDCPF